MGRKSKNSPPTGKRATWEKRILEERANMLRFTARRTIAKKFGIPSSKVEVYHPSSSNRNRRIFEFIEKIQNDPERKWLLTHYRIWPYERIRELAPDHSANEIRTIMLAERNNFRDAKRRMVPTSQTINVIIRKNDLRPEGAGAITSRRAELSTRTRPPNRLPEADRNRLVEETFMALHGKDPSRMPRMFYDPELLDFIQTKLVNEARRFPFPTNLSEKDRAILFEKIVRMKMRTWLKDGLRAVGLYTRSGRQRRPLVSSPLAEDKAITRPAMQVDEIPPALLEKLSEREKIVVEMLLQDAKRTEIARRLHITGTRVSQIVAAIRSRI